MSDVGAGDGEFEVLRFDFNEVFRILCSDDALGDELKLGFNDWLGDEFKLVLDDGKVLGITLGLGEGHLVGRSGEDVGEDV